MHGRDLVEIDHDGLDLLGAHHRAHPAARGQPRRPSVLVAERDAREQALVLTHGATQRNRHLLAIVRVQHALGLEVALAHVGSGIVEVNGAVLLEVDHHPVRRGAVEREAGDLVMAEAIAERSAPVRLLDASGEWALAADARAVRVGEARAGEGPRGEDERVGGGQRIHGGRVQLQQRLGDQVAPGFHDRLAFEVALVDGLIAQLDVVVVAHRRLLAVGRVS